jgi:hypothetical protein
VIAEAIDTALTVGWALAAWTAPDAFCTARGNLGGPEKVAVRLSAARTPRE